MDGMRRIRKALILLVALLAAGILGLEALNRTLLPVKARRWAEESATRAIGRKVSVGAVRLSLWRGFLLERVSIEEDPAFGTGPFLEADQISGGVLFLPLLEKREILIPVLHLVRPKIRLLQDAQGHWNFQSLPAGRPKAPAPEPRFRFSVPKILLTEGLCEIRIARPEGVPSIRFEKLEADLHLSMPAQIRGAVTAQVSADGTDGNPIEQLGGLVSMEWEVSRNSQGFLEIDGEARMKGLQWKIFKIEGSGDLSGRFGTQAAPLRKQDLLKSLKGSLQLEGLRMISVPHVGELRDLTGELAFDASGVRTERLDLRFPDGTPAQMSGSLSNDETRSFGFRAAAVFRAEQPPPLPPEWARLLKKLNLSSGQISLEAIGNGSLLPQFTLRPTVIARLEKIVLQPERAPRLEVQSGQVRWQPELVTFTDVNGSAGTQPFRLEGTLANWEQPEINASFSWGKLDGEAQVSLTSEKISVEAFTGRFGQGSFRLFGEIAWPQPEANLYGEAAFQVEDLGQIWPAARDWLKLHPAEGDLSLRWLLQGPLNRPAGWDLDLHASSNTLQIREIPLQKSSFHLRQKEGVTTLHSAQAGLAGGTVSATGALDRAQTPARWWARLDADAIQLAELARALKWKTQEALSGQLQADWTGEGAWGDLKSFAGPGNLDVAGAQILELPLMGRFAEFLDLPTLRTIRFHEAKGPFRVKEGRVETDSLMLQAPQATLTISGWGGFLSGAESPIQWKILPTFAPELVPEQSRARLGRVIAKGASYFVGEVQLSGTWKEPNPKFVPKKLTQVLNEQLFNLQDLLSDLF